MTSDKEQLLADIKATVVKRIDEKFRKGDAEHSNDLAEVDFVAEAIDEVIDTFVYLISSILIKQRNEPKANTAATL